MNSTQFRAALDSLGLTQAQFSRCLGVDVRSVRRWGSGERKIHPIVVILLQLMLAGYIDPESITHVRRIPREK